jgi:hypothetical protein
MRMDCRRTGVHPFSTQCTRPVAEYLSRSVVRSNPTRLLAELMLGEFCGNGYFTVRKFGLSEPRYPFRSSATPCASLARHFLHFRYTIPFYSLPRLILRYCQLDPVGKRSAHQWRFRFNRASGALATQNREKFSCGYIQSLVWFETSTTAGCP